MALFRGLERAEMVEAEFAGVFLPKLWIAGFQFVLVVDGIEFRVFPVLWTKADQPFAHRLVEQPVVVVDIQRFVPVCIDVISPIERPLDYPVIAFPAEDSDLALDNVIVEQAAIKPVALIVCDEIGIGIRARCTATKNRTLRISGMFRSLFLGLVFQIPAIEFAAL